MLARDRDPAAILRRHFMQRGSALDERGAVGARRDRAGVGERQHGNRLARSRQHVNALVPALQRQVDARSRCDASTAADPVDDPVLALREQLIRAGDPPPRNPRIRLPRLQAPGKQGQRVSHLDRAEMPAKRTGRLILRRQVKPRLSQDSPHRAFHQLSLSFGDAGQPLVNVQPRHGHQDTLSPVQRPLPQRHLGAELLAGAYPLIAEGREGLDALRHGVAPREHLAGEEPQRRQRILDRGDVQPGQILAGRLSRDPLRRRCLHDGKLPAVAVAHRAAVDCPAAARGAVGVVALAAACLALAGHGDTSVMTARGDGAWVSC